MTKSIENLLIFIALYSSFIPTVLFFIFIKYLKREKGLTLIAISAPLFFLIDEIGERFAVTRIFIFSTFTIFEFLVFAFFIFLNLREASLKKVSLVLSALIVIFLSVYRSLWKVRRLDSIPIGIETVFILLFSLFYFYERMNDTENIFIYNQFHFWVVTGIILYLGCSFFIYVLANHVSKETLHKYWFLTDVFYTLKNIFFAIAMLIRARQLSSKTKKPKNSMLYQLN